MFEKNIGFEGRAFRFVIALLLLGYAYWQHSWIALGFAIFTFLEVYLSWCVLYRLLGKNSCPIEKRNKKK